MTEGRERLEGILTRTGLTYIKGGNLALAGATAPSRSLDSVIRSRDFPGLDDEFDRAIHSLESEPREAVLAAANILEAICKIHIEDEGLEWPARRDLQSLWPVVRKNLGFDPARLQDEDLKWVLSGMIFVVDGLASFWTHASSAHAEGRRRYNPQPRHARLVVNAARTLATFVLETWDQRRAGR